VNVLKYLGPNSIENVIRYDHKFVVNVIVATEFGCVTTKATCFGVKLEADEQKKISKICFLDQSSKSKCLLSKQVIVVMQKWN